MTRPGIHTVHSIAPEPVVIENRASTPAIPVRLAAATLAIHAILIPFAAGTAEAGAPEQVAQAETAAVILPPRFTGSTRVRAERGTAAVEAPRTRLTVDRFEIQNSPLVSAREIEEVLAPWNGRDLTLGEFEQAVHAVADYLRENGHPDAEVTVSRTDIARGVVAIGVQGLSPGEAAPPQLAVREFVVTGQTLASADELRQVLAPWGNRDLTVEQMQAAADAVAALIRAKGYPLAQAYLPRQRVDDGVVEIAVLEGVLDGTAGTGGITVVDAGKRVRPQLVEAVIAKGVTPGQPLRGEDLDRALRLAGDIPGIDTVQATLVPGDQPGTTQIQATVRDDRLVSAQLWADNHGNRFSGEGRVNGLFALNSPLGYGEQLSANVTWAERTTAWKLAAQAPAGASGLQAGVAYGLQRVEIGEELAPLNLNSRTEIASLFLNYPLVRTEFADTTISFNLDHKDVENNLLGLRDSDRRIPLATLSLFGHGPDPWGGRNSFMLALSGGRVDLDSGSAYGIRDAQTARTAGQFARLTAAVGRVQPIDDEGRLRWLVSLTSQYATKNLDSVEKFQLGGPNAVRAYPTGEGLGDRGWLATTELHFDLLRLRAGTLGLFAFADAGGIQQYARPWAGALGPEGDNSYMLAGYGAGLGFDAPGYGAIRVTVADKLGPNPGAVNGRDSDGTDREPRIWIFGNIKY